MASQEPDRGSRRRWFRLPGQQSDPKESPREAHYYFSGTRLEAVRSGPWKLAVIYGNLGEDCVERHEPEGQAGPGVDHAAVSQAQQAKAGR